MADINPAARVSVSQYLGQEFLITGLGQLDDISLGVTIHNPTRDDIVRMYRHKTARYSFALPLVLAALTTNKTPLVLNLEQIGEHMGMAYQIRDDMIDFSETSGKTRGSDIRQNKYTLIRSMLYEHATSNEKKKLDGIFGKKDYTDDDIETVFSIAEKYAIIKTIDTMIDAHTTQACDAINTLPIEKPYRDTLMSFARTLSDRTK